MSMQLPPVDRTVSGPPFGTDSQSTAGGANKLVRASRAETSALQQQQAAPQPLLSVKLELSAEVDALIKIEKARAKEAPGNQATRRPSGVEADLQTPGQQALGAKSSPDGVEKPGTAAAAKKNDSPQAVAKYLATGQMPGPEQASSSAEAPSKDWTAKPKTEEVKPPEPPKEPISKKLLEFLQSLWRAGGNAIDVADEANKVLNPPKQADGPLTYADPTSVKKSTGI